MTIPAPQEVLNYANSLKWFALAAFGIWLERKPLGAFIETISDLSVHTRWGDVDMRRHVEQVSTQVDALEAAAKEKVALTALVSGALSMTGELTAQKIEGPSLPEPAATALAEQLALSGWDRIDLLAISNPTAAVITAWERLCDALNAQVLLRRPVQPKHGRVFTGSGMAMILNLPPEQQLIVRQLQNIRNEAAHAKKLDPAVALQYVQTVRRMVTLLTNPPVEEGKEDSGPAEG